MGTSTHNGGQKGGTPLIPSWLEPPTENVIPIPPLGTSDRFTGPRGEFTRYINSGGRNGGQGRKSISTYVKHSLGGSANATKRLGSARSSSAKLLNIAGIFASGGLNAVEQYLSINNLSGKSAIEGFIAIADFVCPDGGPLDEGIARSAYISAIEDSPEIANVNFEDLSAPQIMLIVERSMANVVLGRITNDIANKIIMLPQDLVTAKNIITQMKDFIRGSISDAVSKLELVIENFPQDRSLEIVDSVYTTAFDIMVEVGEQE